MKVFVLMEGWSCDWSMLESGQRIIGVYQDFETAKSSMKKAMEKARQDFETLDTEESDYVEGDMSWSIYEQGEYNYNHIDIQIAECEVE